MPAIRIVIVEDHPLMRQALQMAVEAEPDMQVIGLAAQGQAALQVMADNRPDLVLLDLLMPHMDGFEVIRRLTSEYPEVKILVVSSVTEPDKILLAVSSGADGYLNKDADRPELIAAIRAIAAGDSYLPPKIAAKLMYTLQQQAAHERSSLPLTRREQEIFDLLGRGLSNQQIAQTLHIAEATVRVHLTHLLDKLGLNHRDEAVAYAARQHREYF
jgi:two-component system, NarL family, response regulator LiaR